MRLRQLPVLLLVGVVFTFGVGESAIAKEGHSFQINPFWENLIDYIPLPPERSSETGTDFPDLLLLLGIQRSAEIGASRPEHQFFHSDCL